MEFELANSLNLANYNLLNVLTADTGNCKAKTPCKVDKRTNIQTPFAKGEIKGKSREWFRNTIVINETSGIALKCGEQDNGKHIISLDFDMFVEGSEKPCPSCRAFYDKYEGVSESEAGTYSSSTDGNMNVLCDITDCKALIDMCNLIGTADFKPDQNGGLEIMLTKNQVIPPTATPCKKTGVMGQKREFSFPDEPFYIVKPTQDDGTYTFLFDLLEKGANMKKVRTQSNNITIQNQCNDDDEYAYLLLNGVNSKIDFATEYLPLCSCLKSNGYSYDLWNNWCINNASATDDHHQRLWDDCIISSSYSLYLLEKICKRVNLSFYEQWKKNSVDSRLDKALLRDYSAIDFTADTSKSFSKSGTFAFTDGSVADCFKIFYEGQYVYSKKKMFHFNGVYWKQENDTMSSLSQTIDKEFCSKMEQYFVKKMNDAKRKLLLETDEDKKERISKQLQFLGGATTNLMTTLRKVATRKNFLSDICAVFCNEEQKWNINPLIFCFENCCFDVKTGEQSAPNPEDYINVSTGYDYKPELNSPELRDDLYKIFREMLDKPLTDYLLEILSTGLTGLQIQRVFILTGQGGNGKSVLLDLLLEMLGDYGYLLPQGFISKPIAEGGNPAAAQIGGKRTVLTSEPDEKAGLCASNIKALTGDATLNVRELYSNSTGIDLTLTFLIACNNKPKFDEINPAVRRRLEGGVIPFDKQFVSKDLYDVASDEEKINLRIGDDTYQTREWREHIKFAFFGLLLNAYREKYLVNKLNAIPARVKKEANDYMASSDNIFGWICDNYVKDETCFTTCNDIWMKFNSSAEFYEMTKEEKRKNGTKKKFVEGIQKSIHLRRYFKPRDTYFGGLKHNVPFLAGWRAPIEEDEEYEEEEVCGEDTSTVVDAY